MRIKRGLAKHSKHKRVLSLTKGYRLSYNHLYRRAIEASLHAGQYSMIHRRHRAAQMRQLWIKTISAGLFGTGVSYNKFISGLKQQKIELDRKILAEMATSHPAHFAKVVEASKAGK